MVMADYDVIVVGGGINSLTAAALLGQAGKKVILLEARDKDGGMAATEEFAPGFHCNLVNDYLRWIDPRLLSKLNLAQFGLKMINPDPIRIALNENGQHIRFFQAAQKTASSIAEHSEMDASKWVEFTKYITRLTGFLEPLYARTPPKLPHMRFKDAFTFRNLLKPLLKNSTRGLVDLMRVIPMMMPEFMDEWFESEFVRGSVSSAGIHRITQGPFSAATGLNFLHQHVHSRGVIHPAQFISGGTHKLAHALAQSAASAAVEIHTSTRVVSINTSNGKCSGVTTSNGQSLTAEKVLSGLDPSQTCLKLVGEQYLSPTFRRQLNNIKYRGSTARIHFGLNGLPEINGVVSDEMDTIFGISPSINYLERAYDVAKYGRISENPYIEFTIPSLINPDFAQESKHVLSASVQYVPYHLRDTVWDAELKKKVGEKVVTILEKYIPDFSNLIKDSVLFTPVDLEEIFGITEGNLNHGEMTLDQFFFIRPTISSAQYQTPIKNLFLCGPGTHPGGGLHGANGANATVEILKG